MSERRPRSRNGGARGESLEALRERFNTWSDAHERSQDQQDKFIEERDRRYEDRFKAQESALAAAREADTKLVNAAFASSERAIAKSDEATKTHFELTNNYQRQIEKMITNLATTVFVEREVEALTDKLELANAEIRALREGVASASGRTIQNVENRTNAQWSVGTVIAIVGISLTIISIAIAVMVFATN